MKKILFLLAFCFFSKAILAQSKNQVSIGAKYFWRSLSNNLSSHNETAYFIDYFRNLNEKSAVGIEAGFVPTIYGVTINNYTVFSTNLALNYRRYPIRKEKVRIFYEGGISIERHVLEHDGTATYTNLSSGNPDPITKGRYVLFNYPYFNLKIGAQISVYKKITLFPKLMYQYGGRNNVLVPTLGVGYIF